MNKLNLGLLGVTICNLGLNTYTNYKENEAQRNRMTQATIMIGIATVVSLANTAYIVKTIRNNGGK